MFRPRHTSGAPRASRSGHRPFSVLAMAALASACTAPAPNAQPSVNVAPARATSQPAAGTTAATLVGAQQYTLASPETGKTYRIQVSAIGTPPPGGYPVLYVLDGDALFPMVAMAAQGMSIRARENNASALLVVGVGYPNGQLLDLAARAEDYTPPSASYVLPAERSGTRFGGAEAFHRFLTGTLRQDLARRFDTQPQQQAVLGHSYGALFALYSLLNHPDSFANYLVASPSVWWNQRRILQDWPAFARRQHRPVGVRITVGEYEQTLAPHLPADAQRQARMQENGMVREAQALAEQLAALPAAKVQASELAVYPRETHGSSVIPAITDGLKWLFVRCRDTPGCSAATAP